MPAHVPHLRRAPPEGVSLPVGCPFLLGPYGLSDRVFLDLPLMTFNAGAILSLLVAFQLFFMAAYLFTHKKGNRRNNRLLAALFLMFALNFIDFTLRISGLVLPIPLLHLMDDGFFLLYGPVLYFYTQGVVYRDFAFRKTDSWHMLPYLVVSGWLIFQVAFTNHETQQAFAQRIVSADLPRWVSAISLALYIHILAYLWFSWRTIKAYRSVLKQKFSSIDSINLDWLIFMIRTLTAIVLLALANGIMPAFGNVYFLIASIVALLIVSFYFINRVLVKALNQPVIFSGIEKAETAKYAQSTLATEEIERHKHQLIDLMENDRLFLNPDLKSKDLTDRMGISSKALSQVINQGFEKNFFDFVNTYRCEEVKKVLQGPDRNITIIEAMYRSGFNSKSSFNKEFKKLTGQTPGAFRKSLT